MTFYRKQVPFITRAGRGSFKMVKIDPIKKNMFYKIRIELVINVMVKSRLYVRMY